MKKITYGKLQKKYQGKIFTIFQRPVTLPNGTKEVFEYCERPASVNILAFNDKKELLLIRERRAGSGKLEWFLPVGQLDDRKEKPRSAALRELREETGYGAKKIKMLKKSVTSDKMMMNVYTFVATGLYSSPLPSDVGEHIIKREFFPLKKAVAMALNGTIANEFLAFLIVQIDFLIKRGKWKL